MTEQIDPTPESAEPEGFATQLPHGGTSLWRNRPYVALLTGETVAAVGVEIAQVAIPIIAVTYLVASEFQIGVLGMAEGIAFLLLSLPIGAWVDRVSRRRVMIGANIVRALAMAVIIITPIARPPASNVLGRNMSISPGRSAVQATGAHFRALCAPWEPDRP